MVDLARLAEDVARHAAVPQQLQVGVERGDHLGGVITR